MKMVITRWSAMMNKSLSEALSGIFDEQERRFKDMIEDARKEMTSCYDKFNAELDGDDKEE